MDIAEKIEAALAEIIPLYAQTPEFMGTTPEKYAVYTITEKGAAYGEGVDYETEYLCRLSVFTKYIDYALYRRIKAAMRAADFGYISGGQTGTNSFFPNVTHYYLDFAGVESNE